MAERRQSCDDSYVFRQNDDDELRSVVDAGGKNDLEAFILLYKTFGRPFGIQKIKIIFKLFK